MCRRCNYNRLQLKLQRRFKMEQQVYNHYRAMDIYGNGIGYNVLIIKEDANGDVYFIREEDLDGIDLKRMAHILNRRDANTTALWDVMDQVTLKNGVNALEYFHQLVQVRTSSGQLISPSATRRGLRGQPMQPNRMMRRPTTQQRPANPQGNAPKPENSGNAPKPTKRGPGRPPKNS